MITLDKARYHLRVDGTEDDVEITVKLTLAQAIVSQYLGLTADTITETNVYNAEPPVLEGTVPVSEGVKDAATLLVLAELYANRESSTSTPLSPSVRNLLDALRGPVWA